MDLDIDLLVPTQVSLPALRAHSPLVLSYRELTVAFSAVLGSRVALPEVSQMCPEASLLLYLS